MTSADEMAATARNAGPLHDHEGVNAGPWTADTLAAHLVNLHGIDSAREAHGLEHLTKIHDLLRHGPAAEPAGPEPRRRYRKIYWGPLRTSDNPEDSDLYLASDNGTTIICFTPADRALLAAVASPDTRPGPVDAAGVEAFLARLTDADGLSADEEDAVQTVLEVLTRDKTAWNS